MFVNRGPAKRKENLLVVLKVKDVCEKLPSIQHVAEGAKKEVSTPMSKKGATSSAESIEVSELHPPVLQNVRLQSTCKKERKSSSDLKVRDVVKCRT